MMKFSLENRKIETNISLGKKEVTISANAKAFRIILGQIYPDIIKAVVRELFTNAWDSQKGAGTLDTPIEIHSPNTYEPYFSIRDFGSGMTPKLIDDIYSRIFESTKDKSNDEAGTFGMGSKTPLGYQDNFTLISYVDGSYYYYDIYIAENGSPIIDLKEVGHTDEPNGVFIQLAVRNEDIEAFKTNITHFVFGANTPVKLNSKKMDNTYKVLYEKELYETVESTTVSGPHIRMGPVLYRLNFSLLGRDSNGTDYSGHFGRFPLILKFNIGDFEVTGSREDILYNADSRNKIFTSLASVKGDILKDVQDEIDKCENFNDAYACYMRDHREKLGTLINMGYGYTYSNKDFPFKFNGESLIRNITFENFDPEDNNKRIAAFSNVFAPYGYNIRRKDCELINSTLTFTSLVDGNQYGGRSLYRKPVCFLIGEESKKISSAVLKIRADNYARNVSGNSKTGKFFFYRGKADDKVLEEIREIFGGLYIYDFESMQPEKKKLEKVEKLPLSCYYLKNGMISSVRKEFDEDVFHDKYFVPLFRNDIVTNSKKKLDTVDIVEFAYNTLCPDTDKKLAMVNKTDMKIAEKNGLINILEDFEKYIDNYNFSENDYRYQTKQLFFGNAYAKAHLKFEPILEYLDVGGVNENDSKFVIIAETYNWFDDTSKLMIEAKKRVAQMEVKEKAITKAIPILEHINTWNSSNEVNEIIKNMMQEKNLI
jgi:hypothetical protein